MYGQGEREVRKQGVSDSLRLENKISFLVIFLVLSLGDQKFEYEENKIYIYKNREKGMGNYSRYDMLIDSVEE